ncbi:TRAP transporter substrate-binding protein DctP [Paraburkholderia hospita]|jgi:TRAP-type C4-dicarboxylate transport system substrate-binding protein|uniref:TRAP transporter substrate-binding protein DctP n=1 Tax=Paraburkholderia hospita TaxID=169430 RepID=UPI0002718B5C|nr:TRAP transporter substrate-binding protein DctP [Paraburkholderia hospita]EUC20926.1 Extracellular solute-binding protein, family 7 [Burkholderia sp. BT03]SKC57942.1 TRAP-type C4-dicarboxylate transport system, substrate-binding protein [Paraburkholderia hospita]
MNLARSGQLIRHAVLVIAFASGLADEVVYADQTWTIASDHPADTVAGRGVESFATSLARQTGGALTGRIESRDMAAATDLVAAVLGDSVQVADVFAGTLASFDPIFELPTLPFMVNSVEESGRLACLAGPAYQRALSRAGLHLLFISPWPPTGLWTRQPVAAIGDIANLRVRTYDKSSAAVMGALGAHATTLPIRDVEWQLRVGGIDAVLSSGDGAVGRSLQADLSNFNAIHYAYPVSFVVMSRARYDVLPEKTRRELDEVAMNVGRAQWRSLPARIQANYAEMQRAGVVVNSTFDAELNTRLHKAGEARVREWLSRVSLGDAGIIKAFQNREAPAAQDSCPLDLIEVSGTIRG